MGSGSVRYRIRECCGNRDEIRFYNYLKPNVHDVAKDVALDLVGGKLGVLP